MRTPFLNEGRPTVTLMAQAETPERAEELMTMGREGADAFGLQLCKLRPEYHNEHTFRRLIDFASPRATYVTYYRDGYNKGKSDEQIADALVDIAGYGPSVVDVIGDTFDPRPDQLAVDPAAIARQTELIGRIHAKGAKVLMSCHIHKFITPERALEIALEHNRRGADISKMVVHADTPEQELENLKIITMLRERAGIPVLFLSSGESAILRRLGGEFGSCAYLCVAEHDHLSTAAQPLLSQILHMRSALGR